MGNILQSTTSREIFVITDNRETGLRLTFVQQDSTSAGQRKNEAVLTNTTENLVEVKKSNNATIWSCSMKFRFGSYTVILANLSSQITSFNFAITKEEQIYKFISFNFYRRNQVEVTKFYTNDLLKQSDELKQNDQYEKNLIGIIENLNKINNPPPSISNEIDNLNVLLKNVTEDKLKLEQRIVFKLIQNKIGINTTLSNQIISNPNVNQNSFADAKIILQELQKIRNFRNINKYLEHFIPLAYNEIIKYLIDYENLKPFHLLENDWVKNMVIAETNFYNALEEVRKLTVKIDEKVINLRNIALQQYNTAGQIFIINVPNDITDKKSNYNSHICSIENCIKLFKDTGSNTLIKDFSSVYTELLSIKQKYNEWIDEYQIKANHARSNTEIQADKLSKYFKFIYKNFCDSTFDNNIPSTQFDCSFNNLSLAIEEENKIHEYGVKEFPYKQIERVAHLLLDDYTYAVRDLDTLNDFCSRVQDYLPDIIKYNGKKIDEIDFVIDYLDIQKSISKLKYDAYQVEMNIKFVTDPHLSEEYKKTHNIEDLRAKEAEIKKNLLYKMKTLEEVMTNLYRITVRIFPDIPLTLKEPKLSAYINSAGLVHVHRSLSDYEQVNILASSRHTVYSAVYDGKPCVLKKYEIREGKPSFLKEAQLLYKLSHPSIADIQAIFFDGENVAYIQLPLYGITLNKWSETRPNEYQIKKVLQQILSGIEFMHDNAVIHCDLKPSNIVLDEKNHPRILDFDISKTIEQRSTISIAQTTIVGGTPEYMAIELFKNHKASKSTDMYSFGCIMFELHFPYTKRPTILELIRIEGNTPIPDHKDQHMKSLLTSLLSPDPKQRPSARQALSSEYFKNDIIDDNIQSRKNLAQELNQYQLQIKNDTFELDNLRESLKGIENQIFVLRKNIFTLKLHIGTNNDTSLQQEIDNLTSNLTKLELEYDNSSKTLEKKSREIQDTKTLCKEKQSTILDDTDISFKPPPYWQMSSLIPFIVQKIDVTDTYLDKMSQVVNKTCISEYIGKCIDAPGLTHSHLRVIRVEKIENTRIWLRYIQHRSIISYGGPFTEIKIECFEEWMRELSLATHINEWFLFHGTKKDKIDIIINGGFDERIGRLNGLFGSGCYFTENSSKADEYADQDNQGESYMFLCRVCMGVPFITTKPHQNIRLPPPVNGNIISNSLLGECKRTGYHNAYLNKYREFVIYDRTQTYPEFLITYKRI